MVIPKVPFIGGFAYGIGLAPLVVTGMHHAFLPVHIQLMANGGDYIWPIESCQVWHKVLLLLQ